MESEFLANQFSCLLKSQRGHPTLARGSALGFKTGNEAKNICGPAGWQLLHGPDSVGDDSADEGSFCWFEAASLVCYSVWDYKQQVSKQDQVLTSHSVFSFWFLFTQLVILCLLPKEKGFSAESNGGEGYGLSFKRQLKKRMGFWVAWGRGEACWDTVKF